MLREHGGWDVRYLIQALPWSIALLLVGCGQPSAALAPAAPLPVAAAEPARSEVILPTLNGKRLVIGSWQDLGLNAGTWVLRLKPAEHYQVTLRFDGKGGRTVLFLAAVVQMRRYREPI